MTIAVIIPAAGVGRRFTGAGGPGGASAAGKLEADLAGKPVFLRSIELFLGRPTVRQIILAVNPQTIDEFRFRWGDKLRFHGVEVIPGGVRERWETVQLALERVADDATHIAVHDAARPLASDALIERLFEAVKSHAAVVPAMPVSNTLKRVSREDASVAAADPLDAILGGAGNSAVTVRRVIETIDRRDLVEVQTPQVFEASLLRRAYARIDAGDVDPATITDDAGLVEAMNDPQHSVVTVEGEPTNFKITRPGDLELASALMEKRQANEAKERAKKQLFGDDED